MASIMTDKVVYASKEEQRRWNWLSEEMNSYHQWFKDRFKVIEECADGSFTKRRMTLPMYLDLVNSFISSLTAHHTVEERFIFPVLAKRIPKFAHDNEDGHVNSHRAIHDGLDDLTKHSSKWRHNPSSYSPAEMKVCLDNLKGVLFEHLDQEVEDIKGDKLRPHFKLEEIEQFRR